MRFEKSICLTLPPKLEATIRIIILDDNRLFIRGLISLINEIPQMVCSRTFLTDKDLLNWYDGHNADIIIVPIQFPFMNGMELAKNILTVFPESKIAILLYDDSPQTAQKLRDMGVAAFLKKDAEDHEIIDSIIHVADGVKIFRNRTIQKPDLHNLSKRELQVLKLIIQGKTTPQIAQQLIVSPLTIKTHRQNLLKKLDASNVAQLIEKATLKGIIY